MLGSAPRQRGPFAPPFALRQEIPARSVGKGIGHFFGAMQIDGFIDKAEFKKQIDDWIQVFRNTKPAPGTNGPLIQPSANDMQRPATDQTEYYFPNFVIFVSFVVRLNFPFTNGKTKLTDD